MGVDKVVVMMTIMNSIPEKQFQMASDQLNANEPLCMIVSA